MNISFQQFVSTALKDRYVVLMAIDHGVAQGFLRTEAAEVICLEHPAHGVMYFNPANVISIRPIEEPK